VLVVALKVFLPEPATLAAFIETWLLLLFVLELLEVQLNKEVTAATNNITLLIDKNRSSREETRLNEWRSVEAGSMYSKEHN